MATARSVGARTAAGLVVTVGVCLSATAIASSSQLAGPGHARVRGTGPARPAAPLAQPRSAPAPAVSVTSPAAAGGTSALSTAGVQEHAARLRRGSAPRRTSASARSPLRAGTPSGTPARAPSAGPPHRRRLASAGGPRRAAGDGSPGAGHSQRQPERPVGPSTKSVSSDSKGVTLSSAAADEASGPGASAKVNTNTSRRGRSTPTRKAKSATGSARGRNRGAGRGSTSGSSAATGGRTRATGATSSAGSPSVAAPAAPSVALVPQIGAIASKPFGPATPRRSGANAPLATPLAAFEAGPARAASASGVGGKPARTTRSALRSAASRGPARGHSTSNPLEAIGKRISLPVPVPDWSKPIIVALLIIALWFGVRSRMAALRARRLERQRVRLLSDLDAMQAALVPEIPRRLGPLEVSVAYRPAEGPAAGGDFYDVFEPRPGQMAVLLGDVAGHGHEALKHAALTHFTLRAYLQAGLEPRAALALAGQVLCDPTGERYATVAVAVYDEPSSTLTYALAGHPPPMLLGYPAHEPVTVCSSPPIGWGIPTGRRQTTISLPAGAIACFFSDGLIEARREGQLLGRGQLREILAALGDRPDAADLLAQVRAAAQGAPDDMVACVLSPARARSGAYVHVEELEADSRTLSRAGVRRFLRECAVPPVEAKRALEQARQVAAKTGTALLRVRFEPDRTTVYVAATGRAAPHRREQRQPQPGSRVAEPLLEALAAG
jgi:hypothetical protein